MARDLEKRRASQRAFYARHLEEQRARQRTKKNQLREPRTLAAWRASLRWNRLLPQRLEAQRLEARAEARDVELRDLAEVWHR